MLLLKCCTFTILADGVTGFTLNQGALQRWILLQSDRAALTNECQTMEKISTGFT